MEQENNRLYNIVLVFLVIALFVTSIAVFIVRSNIYEERKNQPFTELFYPYPDSLPNQISQDTDYDYTFSIRSNEHEERNLSYTSSLELYNLYDLIESRYECLSRYREKVYLKWTNETANSTFIKEPRRYQEIQDLQVHPSYQRKVNWSSYTVEFGFTPEAGKGQLAIYFRDEEDVKYFIVIDEQNNKTFFNFQQVSRGLPLEDGNNKAKIVVTENQIDFYINDIRIFTELSDYLHDGSFGFESRNAYYKVAGFKVYKDKPYDVPETENIIEHDIGLNLLYNKVAEVRDLHSKSVPLIRSFRRYNETIDCEEEPFYCEYFDLPNDISFYLDETNITKVVEKVPVVERNINYVLYPLDESRSRINWSEFHFQFSHQQMQEGSQGAIILNFEPHWAIMVTRNNSYFIRPKGGQTVVDEIRNPKKENESTDLIDVNITSDHITLKINNKTVFIRDSPEQYTDGTLNVYVKNVFLLINPIGLINQHPDCDDENSLRFCELVLQISSGQRRPETTAEQGDNYLIEERGFDSKARSFSLTRRQDEEVEEETRYDVNIPIYNPFIPDKRIVFNTPSTTILNKSNFSIDFSYTGLDGARVMEAGLLDMQGNELISISVLERQDLIIVHHKKKNISEYHPLQRYINLSSRHYISMKIEQGDAIFSLDKKEIFRINDTYIRHGQFFIGMRNTYSDVGYINLKIEDIAYSRRFKIHTNPCDLKLIHRSIIDDNEISLGPGEEFRVQHSFNVKRDFDYGKVSTELWGSSNMTKNESLEIHFWVMRDD